MLDEQLMRVIAVIRLYVQIAATVLILVAVPTAEIDEIDEMRCSVRNRSTLFEINFISFNSRTNPTTTTPPPGQKPAEASSTNTV